MKTSINMAAYDTSVKVLGPGKRFVVWFQGCPFNCSSCINQSFKAFTEATVIEVAELLECLPDCLLEESFQATHLVWKSDE